MDLAVWNEEIPQSPGGTWRNKDEDGQQSSGDLIMHHREAEEAENKVTSWTVLFYEWFRELESWQIGMLVFGIVMLFWCFTVTGMLLAAALQYLNTVVSAERATYTTAGAVVWAKVEASRLLITAFHVKDALRAAVRSGLLRGSWDATTLEQILASTFASAQFVHSLDLVFADSTPSMMVVSHTVGNSTGDLQVAMQSNSENCFLFGSQGCFLGDPPTGDEPSWLQSILLLPPLTPEELVEVDAVRKPRSSRNGDAAEAERKDSADVPSPYEFPGDAAVWDTRPDFVLEPSKVDSFFVDTWSPAYRLLFRLADAGWGGDPAAAPTLAGRIALRLTTLSGGRLQDKRLGDSAKIYLCDRQGTVLASPDPTELVALRPPSGRLRMRFLSELPSAAAWADTAAPAFSSGQDLEASLDDGTFVVVSFLHRPLDRFAIVVVVPSTEAFVDGSMQATSLSCLVFAGMPYLLAACGGLGFLARRHLRFISEGYDEDEYEPDGWGRGRLSRRNSNSSNMSRRSSNSSGSRARRPSVLMKMRRMSATRHLDTMWGAVRSLNMAKKLEAMQQDAMGLGEGDEAVPDKLALPDNPKAADSADSPKGAARAGRR